jgi:hypothetical protein
MMEEEKLLLLGLFVHGIGIVYILASIFCAITEYRKSWQSDFVVNRTVDSILAGILQAILVTPFLAPITGIVAYVIWLII